jgi:hypothetical protein
MRSVAFDIAGDLLIPVIDLREIEDFASCLFTTAFLVT